MIPLDGTVLREMNGPHWSAALDIFGVSTSGPRKVTITLSDQCLVTRETLCLGRVNVPLLLRHSSKGKDAPKMCIQVVEFVT